MKVKLFVRWGIRTPEPILRVTGLEPAALDRSTNLTHHIERKGPVSSSDENSSSLRLVGSSQRLLGSSHLLVGSTACWALNSKGPKAQRKPCPTTTYRCKIEKIANFDKIPTHLINRFQTGPPLFKRGSCLSAGLLRHQHHDHIFKDMEGLLHAEPREISVVSV